jgi:hypothetical protein
MWRSGGRCGTGKFYCVQKGRNREHLVRKADHFILIAISGEEGVYTQNWSEEFFEFFDKGPKINRIEELPEVGTPKKRKFLYNNESEDSPSNSIPEEQDDVQTKKPKP